MKKTLKKLIENNLRTFARNKTQEENKSVNLLMKQVRRQIKELSKTNSRDLFIIKISPYSLGNIYGEIKDHTHLKKSYRVSGVTFFKEAEGPIRDYELFGPVKKVFNNLEKQGLNPYILRTETPTIFEMSLGYSLRVNLADSLRNP